MRSLRDELSARIAPEYQTYKESAGTEMSAEEAEQRGWEIIQDLVARWAADEREEIGPQLVDDQLAEMTRRGRELAQAWQPVAKAFAART